jgi:hypothetical protein
LVPAAGAGFPIGFFAPGFSALAVLAGLAATAGALGVGFFAVAF